MWNVPEMSEDEFNNFSKGLITSGSALGSFIGAANNALDFKYLKNYRDQISNEIKDNIAIPITDLSSTADITNAFNNQDLYSENWKDYNTKMNNLLPNSNIFPMMASGAGAGASIGGNFGTMGKLIGSMVGAFAGAGIGMYSDAHSRNLNKQYSKELASTAKESNLLTRGKLSTGVDNMNSNNYRSMMANIGGQPIRAYGGKLYPFGGALSGYGGDWTNGLTFINNGGTHEENPYEGVPVSIAQDGQPNLVEEGEVVWNDYVFSNRLEVPKEIMEQMKLGKGKKTFAEIVEKVQKEAAERPNDAIAKRGLEDSLQKLAAIQEQVRAEKEQQDAYNQAEDTAAMYADGGPIHIAKNKRGTFTAAATKHGMGVQEFAKHVLSNKDKYSTNMVRKAVFAHNANNWEHGYGGYLNNPYISYALGGHLYAYGDPPVTSDERTSGTYTVIGNEPVVFWNDDDEDTSIVTAAEGPYAGIPVYDPGSYHVQVPKGSGPYQHFPEYLSPEDPLLPGLGQVHPDSDKIAKDNQPTIDTLTTFKAPPYSPSENKNKGKGKDKYQFDESWLRYAPVLGSAIGSIASLLDKPDMEYANAIEKAGREAARKLKDVKAKPIGDYLAYNPFDRLFYANQLGAQTAAQKRAIENATNGNIGAALAGLANAGYNANVALGQLYRQGEEYNLAQRQKVADFNRGTNIFNSQEDLRAQMSNAQTAAQRASIIQNALTQAAALKLGEKNRIQEARSLNLTNFFDNLGNVGWEAYNRNMINDNQALLNNITRNGFTPYRGGLGKTQWESMSDKAKDNFLKDYPGKTKAMIDEWYKTHDTLTGDDIKSIGE